MNDEFANILSALSNAQEGVSDTGAGPSTMNINKTNAFIHDVPMLGESVFSLYIIALGP